MAQEPDLRPGDADPEWTKYLNEVLRSLGLDPGPEDESYDEDTENAVRAFQASNDCTQDGWVGAQTWEAIQRLLDGGTDGGDTGGAGESGSGDVPAELVSIGLPDSTENFTAEQRDAVFVGEDLGDEEDAGSPEGVELLAINEGDDEGGSWA